MRAQTKEACAAAQSVSDAMWATPRASAHQRSAWRAVLDALPKLQLEIEAEQRAADKKAKGS